MQGCFSNVIDTRMSRDFRFAGGRSFSIQFDMFNAFNIVNINGRSTSIQYNSPTDQTVRNSETFARRLDRPNAHDATHGRLRRGDRRRRHAHGAAATSASVSDRERGGLT